MRKAARVLGLAWMANAVLVALLFLLQNATMQGRAGGYALVPILFLGVMPGALLFGWGRGPYRRRPSAAELLRPKAPYDRAAEAGHVLHLIEDESQSDRDKAAAS